MNTIRVRWAAVAVALVAAGCSAGSDASPGASTVSGPGSTAPAATTTETITSTTLAPTTPALPPTAEATVAGPPFTTTRDVAYMTLDDTELRLDVYTPTGVGPWPVVVAFHGRSERGKDAPGNELVPVAAAEAGMVVFVPTWYSGDPFPLMLDDIEMLTAAGNCAVAYAQEHAAEHGGDAARTVVYGFSAGTGPALAAAVAPREEMISGCEARTPPGRVTGAVLGDGEYFWQSDAFDAAFAADLGAMQAAVAAFSEPASWPDDLDAAFFLWAAAEGTAPRAVDDPWDDAGWLATRDPGGSIRNDLEQLDQLADGVISYIDSAELLRLRLAEADQDVALTIAPGGHTIEGKVPELVEWLAAAAG